MAELTLMASYILKWFTYQKKGSQAQHRAMLIGDNMLTTISYHHPIYQSQANIANQTGKDFY